MTTCDSIHIKHLLLVSFTIFFFLSNASASDEPEDNILLDGEKLHEKSCVKCHEDDMYTRKDRTIKSYQELELQVNRCNEPAKANWNPGQINVVTDFLNDRYYKFDPLN